MSTTLAATVLASSPHTSAPEAIVFWIIAPIAIGSALAMVFSRHAVHAALFLVADFFCLAVLYAVQDAPFLAAVQVIVYTGAIMILFLFVLMLVGVDSSDSLVETLRGQRIAGAVLALGFLLLLVGAIGNATLDAPSVGLSAANAEGNLVAIARLLFTRYVFAFEATSALLITAAMGAMVLAHPERTEPKVTQKERSRRRFASGHPTPLPSPGVLALHDSVDTLALLPDGSPVARNPGGPNLDRGLPERIVEPTTTGGQLAGAPAGGAQTGGAQPGGAQPIGPGGTP